MRIGSGTPFSVTRPPSSASTSFRFMDSQMDSAKTTSPGPARPRTREAMFTGSPKTSPLSRRTSPTFAPARTSIRSHSGTLWFQSQMRSCTAAPQRTAWVGDSKATRRVPPMVFTRRPWKARNTGMTSASWSRSMRWLCSYVRRLNRSA